MEYDPYEIQEQEQEQHDDENKIVPGLLSRLPTNLPPLFQQQCELLCREFSFLDELHVADPLRSVESQCLVFKGVHPHSNMCFVITARITGFINVGKNKDNFSLPIIEWNIETPRVRWSSISFTYGGREEPALMRLPNNGSLTHDVPLPINDTWRHDIPLLSDPLEKEMMASSNVPDLSVRGVLQNAIPPYAISHALSALRASVPIFNRVYYVSPISWATCGEHAGLCLEVTVRLLHQGEISRAVQEKEWELENKNNIEARLFAQQFSSLDDFRNEMTRRFSSPRWELYHVSGRDPVTYQLNRICLDAYHGDTADDIIQRLRVMFNLFRPADEKGEHYMDDEVSITHGRDDTNRIWNNNDREIMDDDDDDDDNDEYYIPGDDHSHDDMAIENGTTERITSRRMVSVVGKKRRARDCVQYVPRVAPTNPGFDKILRDHEHYMQSLGTDNIWQQQENEKTQTRDDSDVEMGDV